MSSIMGAISGGNARNASLDSMSTVLELLPQSPPEVDRPSLAGVLAEIAETAAETIELQEVFDRVATAIRRLIPLDSMGVVRILEGRWLVLHAITCRVHQGPAAGHEAMGPCPPQEDRKSTRLNSSHLGISYAVFCLKNKR